MSAALEKAKAYTEAVRRVAAGRWREALIDAGVDAGRLSKRNGPCPGCGGRNRFRFDDRHGNGDWFCSQGGNGDAFGDGFALIQHVHGCDFMSAVERIGDVFGIANPLRAASADTDRHRKAKTEPRPIAAPPAGERFERLSEFGWSIWRECARIQAEALGYLRARSCVIPPADGDLRFHKALRFPGTDYVGPALVGLITDAVSGEALSLHQTWIRGDGTKPFDNSRRYLGKHSKQGGVIRLWPSDSVTIGLGVAEGVESALSLAHAFTPVWSLMDAGNLAGLQVLDGIEALTIAADNDPAGLKAANDCALRWAKDGREVRIVRAPSSALNDLNDLAVAA